MRADHFHCGFRFLAGLVADDAALKERESYFGTGQDPKGRHSKRCRIAGVMVLCVLSSMAADISRAAEPVFDIDIPAMNAAEALNRLAEQTGSVMLFSYDLARAREANAVRGRYTLLEGLELLLRDTGLSGGLSDKRVVIIAANGKVPGGKGETVKKRGLLAALIAALFGSTAGESSADQTEEGTRQETPTEEIIVTATRRAENIRDVPISITAISAAEIDRRGLGSAADYLRGIPGVNQVDSSNNQSIVIRGIETSPQNQNFAAGATTATYFGETPTTNSAGLGAGTSVDLKLVDIERVEVLRGPQGTAFGNSSMGGAVRIIPVAPNPDRLEGKLAAGYSGTSGTGGDNHAIQATANVPLVRDKFAIRATAYQHADGGYYRNRAGSDADFRARVVVPFGVQAFAADEEEVGSHLALGGRVAALVQPSDAFKLTLGYLTQTTEMDGFALASSGGYEQTLLQVAPEHVSRGERGGVLDTDIDIANATMDFDLGWASLLATFSHTDSGSRRAQHLVLSNFGLPISSDLSSDHQEDVGEIRFVTRLDGAWDFLVGLYGEQLTDDALFDFRWFGNPTLNFFAPGQQFLGDQRHGWELTQTAAFGEVSWQFLPALTFTGGVRAYDYERTIELEQVGAFFNPMAPNARTATRTDSDASGSNFRANLSYSLGDRGLLYGGWSQGFRVGKPQAPLTQCDRNADGVIDGTNILLESTGRVDSDAVDSYELGGKFALLERRLTVDAAVFRMEWSDIPVSVLAGSLSTGCGFVYVTNAGEALSEGVEFQTSFYLTQPLRIDAGASWIDARLTKDAPAVPALDGDRLPGSPKFNANLGVQYEFGIGSYEAFVRADSIYVGEFFGNLQQSSATKSGGYVKLDASARVRIRDFSVDLFVRNVTNEDDFTFRDAIPRGDLFGYRLRPRTFGIQLGYAF